jgi:uncharacterized protein YhfF
MTLAEAKARFPGAETFTFGDSAALSDRLLMLVRNGKKRATCGALRDFLTSGDALPIVGRRDIALTWDGAPAFLIETTEVTIRLFRDVDAAFALAEGEDDTLEGWQDGHRRYFQRNGGWSPDMDLVCERFELIEDFA